MTNNMRFLWAQGAENHSEAGVDDLLQRAQAMHITDILYLAHNSGEKALYPSQTLSSGSLRVGGTHFFNYLVGAATDAGIDVHAWLAIASWPWMWGMYQDGTPSYKHPSQTWLDMSLPDAQKAIGDLVADLFQSIDGLSGVHLDYIRRAAANDPHIHPDDITACVLRAREATPSDRVLTAATVPHTYSGWDMVSHGVNWNQWIDDGLVDFVAPMLYYNASTVENQLGYITRDPLGIASRVLAGVSPQSPRGAWRGIDDWVSILNVCDLGGFGVALFDDTVVDVNYQPAVEALAIIGGSSMSILADAQSVKDVVDQAVLQLQGTVIELQEQSEILDGVMTALSAIDAEADALAMQAQAHADTIGTDT